MGLFDFFKKKEVAEPTTKDNVKLTTEEIFSSPKLLYYFVKSNFLDQHNIDLDIKLINKLKNSFDIPSHQVQQFIDERELIRIAGCLFCVSHFHNNDFYLEFKEYLLNHLIEKRNQFCDKNELDGVITFYQTEGEPIIYTRHFLDRVFAGNPIHEKLLNSEAILELTFNYFMFSGDNLRKAYPDLVISGE